MITEDRVEITNFVTSYSLNFSLVGGRQSRPVLTPEAGEGQKVEIPTFFKNRGSTMCWVGPTVQGQTPAYPWEEMGGEKTSYIQIKQVFLSGSSYPSQGVWQTPSPQNIYR